MARTGSLGQGRGSKGHSEPAGLSTRVGARTARTNFNLVAHYAERQAERNYSAEDYLRVNDTFVLGGELTEDAISGFYKVQMNAELHRLLVATQQIPALEDELRSLVACCVRYTNETGYIVDLGEDNVILTPQGKTRMVDALYPTDTAIFYHMGAILQKVARAELLGRKELINLFNGRKYVCVINFLSAHLGLSERLYIPGVPTRLDQRWYSVLDTLTSLSSRHDLKLPTQQY